MEHLVILELNRYVDIAQIRVAWRVPQRADVSGRVAAAVRGDRAPAAADRGLPQLGQLQQAAGGRAVHPLHGVLHDTGAADG